MALIEGFNKKRIFKWSGYFVILAEKFTLRWSGKNESQVFPTCEVLQGPVPFITLEKVCLFGFGSNKREKIVPVFLSHPPQSLAIPVLRSQHRERLLNHKSDSTLPAPSLALTLKTAFQLLPAPAYSCVAWRERPRCPLPTRNLSSPDFLLPLPIDSNRLVQITSWASS